MMDKPRELRVLHYSPHDEDDGIAKYQQHYLDSMQSRNEVYNKFFKVSPLNFRHLNTAEKQQVLNELKEELKDFDILHIQHEFGLFMFDEFRRVAEVAKHSGKKLVVSIHLSPAFAIKVPKLGGLGPRSFLHYARQKRYERRMRHWHIEPLLWADVVLVHNESTKQALESFGVESGKVHKLVHPVPVLSVPQETSFIRDNLKKKEGDILYCTVGMMHRYKGVLDAVKALKFLPENYKLAIIGGMHPLSDDVPIYNKVCDTIDQLGLHDRVYITGFVRDDELMNSYIRECDISIFPYNGTYYAHVSSGAINLALANDMPTIAYPTLGFKEMAQSSNGALVLTDTYAYYELAREIQRIDLQNQRQLIADYAKNYAWPLMADKLADIYSSLR